MKKKIFFVSLLALAIDQISKYLIVNLVGLKRICIIKKFFYITYAKNYGAAWSILENKQVLLIIATIIALVFIINLIRKESNIKKIEVLEYGLLIGGIIGNLTDRIIHGYVIDFLDFYIFNYNYPIFNVADSCIVISVFLMIICTIVGGKNESNSK